VRLAWHGFGLLPFRFFKLLEPANTISYVERVWTLKQD
jgi:hypothetical protein